MSRANLVHILDLSLAGIGHKLGISLVMGIFRIFLHIMGILRTYLWYMLGISWVYLEHILGILGHMLKIGFQYISYHLAHLVSIISIFTMLSLPNTTISCCANS